MKVISCSCYINNIHIVIVIVILLCVCLKSFYWSFWVHQIRLCSKWNISIVNMSLKASQVLLLAWNCSKSIVHKGLQKLMTAKQFSPQCGAIPSHPTRPSQSSSLQTCLIFNLPKESSSLTVLILPHGTKSNHSTGSKLYPWLKSQHNQLILAPRSSLTHNGGAFSG